MSPLQGQIFKFAELGKICIQDIFEVLNLNFVSIFDENQYFVSLRVVPTVDFVYIDARKSLDT